MISFFKNINGIHHIALYNYDNRFCYLISAIQRLQCSPTFVQQCISNVHDFGGKGFTDTLQPPNDIFKQLLYPNFIYAMFHHDMANTQNDHASICLRYYTLLKNYIAWMSTAVISERANQGYDTTHVLTYFLLPAVHKMFPTHFQKILSELSINIVDFAPTLTTAQDMIMSDDETFIRDNSYRQLVSEQYCEMRNAIGNGSNEHVPFVCCSWDVFPNKDMLGGHAVTMILGRATYASDTSDSEPSFYIFDDQNSIAKLPVYYKQRMSRIYKILIRDIDEQTIVLLNNILHKECGVQSTHSFVKNVGKYQLDFSSNFASPNIDLLKDDIKEHVRNNPSLSGGSVAVFMLPLILKMIFVLSVMIIVCCATYITVRNYHENLFAALTRV